MFTIWIVYEDGLTEYFSSRKKAVKSLIKGGYNVTRITEDLVFTDNERYYSKKEVVK